MPKYYIQDIGSRYIIDDKNPIDACAKAVIRHSTIVMVNGFYLVSEKGFKFDSEENIKVSSDLVNNRISQILRQKMKDDLDNLA